MVIPARNFSGGWRTGLLFWLALGTASRLVAQGTPGVTLTGPYGFSGTHSTLTMQTGPVANGNLSVKTGALRLELWTTKASFPSVGYLVGTYALNPLAAGSMTAAVNVKVAYRTPPNGTYHTTFVVEENTAFGWVVDTFYQFTNTTAFTMGAAGKSWSPPGSAMAAPPPSLKTGATLTLTVQESGGFVASGAAVIEQLHITDGATLSAKGGGLSQTLSGQYTYKIKSASVAGKTVKVAVLAVNYAALNPAAPKAKSSLTLYFQGPHQGWFVSLGAADGLGLYTRGTFALK